MINCFYNKVLFYNKLSNNKYSDVMDILTKVDTVNLWCLLKLSYEEENKSVRDELRSEFSSV